MRNNAGANIISLQDNIIHSWPVDGNMVLSYLRYTLERTDRAILLPVGFILYCHGGY